MPARPHAIVRTRDGGYVIAGALYENRAWATRVDANMHVMWRNELEHPSLVWGENISAYESAVELADNTTLLCGHADIGTLKAPNIVGLLTRIDGRGAILSREHVTPLGDESYKLAYLQACATTSEGIVAVGNSTRILGAGPIRPAEDFLWVVGLDPVGVVSWQKLIPSDQQSISEQLLVLPNTDLLVHGNNGIALLLDHAGVTKAHQNVGVESGVMVSANPADRVLRLIASGGSAPQLLTSFNAELKQIERKTGKPNNFVVKRAFTLDSGDLALFGYEGDGGESTAAVSWVRHDLTSNETFIFRPTSASVQIDDAVPSGVPGEFAFVRSVVPVRHTLSPSETRLGLILSFMRLN